MIDSHCHLADRRFTDPQSILQRAASAGVNSIIVPLSRAEEWHWQPPPPADGLPTVALSWGLHPWFAHPETLASFPRQYLQDAVAIGECGLDFGPRGAPRHWQYAIFRQQLHLAREHRLPVILHACKSLDAIILEMRKFRDLRYILHGARASSQQLAQLGEYDCFFGIGSNMFRASRRWLEALRQLPVERLLVETDAPDQCPPHRRDTATYNEPAFLPDIVQALARQLQLPVARVQQHTTANARRCFSLTA